MVGIATTMIEESRKRTCWELGVLMQEDSQFTLCSPSLRLNAGEQGKGIIGCCSHLEARVRLL
jgi:hypothetical protein